MPRKSLLPYGRTVLLVGSIFVVFLLMSRIDYIINGTLYNYNLQFSYDWAIGYWLTYNALFICFAVAIGIANWFSSCKTIRDTKFSIALSLTIILLSVGGLQDIMFFVFWSGGLPPSSVVWWWVPWVSIVGTWNSITQVCFTGLMAFFSLVVWLIAFREFRLLQRWHPNLSLQLFQKNRTKTASSTAQKNSS